MPFSQPPLSLTVIPQYHPLLSQHLHFPYCFIVSAFFFLQFIQIRTLIWAIYCNWSIWFLSLFQSIDSSSSSLLFLLLFLFLVFFPCNLFSKETCLLYFVDWVALVSLNMFLFPNFLWIGAEIWIFNRTQAQVWQDTSYMMLCISITCQKYPAASLCVMLVVIDLYCLHPLIH